MLNLSVLLALALIFANTMTSSLGAFAFKKASAEKKAWKYLVWGLAAYFVSSVTLIIALKAIPLGIAYPLTALTYVWTQIIAYKWGGELITSKQKAGVALILGGITCLSIATL